MRYRKKPIVVEAFHMSREHCLDNSEWPSWLHQAWQKPIAEAGALFSRLDGALFVQTLEGTHKVSWDDWIIQGVEGELYPCKPEIFEKTYDAVDVKPFTQMGEGAMW